MTITRLKKVWSFDDTSVQAQTIFCNTKFHLPTQSNRHLVYALLPPEPEISAKDYEHENACQPKIYPAGG
jgi:hypothetical protein